MSAENFKNIVAGSPALKSRWLELSERAARDIEQATGLALDRDRLSELPELRIAVLGGDTYDPLRLADEAEGLEEVRQHVAQEDYKTKLAEGDATAIDSLPKSRQERLALAHRLGQTGREGEAHRPSSIADPATLVRRLMAIKDPSARLRQAREWGVA